MSELSLWALLPAAFVSFALFILLITAVSNIIFFPKLEKQLSAKGKAPDAVPSKLVSILVPARNEAAVISDTVSGLLAQRAVSFELILLDDNSEDETAILAQKAASGDPRFRLITGKPLPPDWHGKNWACHQLSEAARGDLLLFCDADVRWQADGVAALLAAARQSSADLVTVFPTQTAVSWGERLVVPLMKFAIFSYLPILPVHFTNWPAFAAANGQCLLFRRNAYDAIGGHAAVRQEIVEDVMLARTIKHNRRKLRILDGNQLVRCRMYRNWSEVQNGFAKNILAGHNNSPAFLLASTLFHWLVFLWPWLWLMLGGGWWAGGLIVGGLLLRGITAVFAQDRLLDVLFMPISVILMTRIAYRSLQWHLSGGVQWKGRKIQTT